MSPRSRDGDRREVVLPRVGKDLARPLLVEPEELAPAEEEDAAQHERLAAIRVRFGVGQRQGAAPAAAEHDPPIDAEVLAQLLDVRDEIPGRVLPELREGRALAAAALVVQHDAPLLRIEVAVVDRVDAAARPAVQEDERLAARVAALLEVDRVQLRDLRDPRAVRLRLGKEIAQAFRRRFHAAKLPRTPGGLRYAEGQGGKREAGRGLAMPERDWPFDQPRNAASITLRSIVFAGARSCT